MSAMSGGSGGPLAGVRVLDLSGLAPGPLCSMLLADFGAEVVEVRRPAVHGPDPSHFVARNKSSIVIDLRHPDGPELIARMAEQADVLLEGNRPGVMERRGVGPDALLARNPRLIYTRLTGWGQDGSYADRAGHDINYLAISGALGATGTSSPVAPPGLLGDLASGSLLAAFGTIMALYDRERTGRGQVVDAAIVDGAALLMSIALGELNSGLWDGECGTHLLSGNAPFYGVYECADGRWISVGAIEPQFYGALLSALSLDGIDPKRQWDRARWGHLREDIASRFVAKPRDEWVTHFSTFDACVTPVLGINELHRDEHLAARGTVTHKDGRLAAASAPRLSGHPLPIALQEPRHDPVDILGSFGVEAAEVATLVGDGAVASWDDDR